MPPYVGLLDKNRDEIVARGYSRLDMADFHFKISPPRSNGHLTFVNVKPITFPQFTGRAEVASLAVFENADSPRPVVINALVNGPIVLASYDWLLLPSGGLTLEMTVKKDLPRAPVKHRRERAKRSLAIDRAASSKAWRVRKKRAAARKAKNKCGSR